MRHHSPRALSSLLNKAAARAMLALMPLAAAHALAQQAIVTASAQNPPYETAAQAVDNNPVTKWLAFASVGWIQFQYPAAAGVTGFALTSGNDYPVRDPVNVTLMGSNDGQSWTQIQTFQNLQFKNRYQRNAYALTQAASFAYYRVLMQTNDVTLQLAEVELIRSNDAFAAKLPAITYQNLASGTTGGQRFDQVIGAAIVPAAREWSRSNLRTLYPQASDYDAQRNTLLKIEVVDEPGAAWKFCDTADNSVCTVRFSAGYIGERASWSDGDLRHEITGMLIHELGHVYQNVDTGMPGYIVEGVADALRVRNGYHDLKPRIITGAYNANDQAQGEAATFYVWLDEFKLPGMLAAFNASLSPHDGQPFNEDAVFLQKLGKTRQQLWNEARNTYWWQ